MGKYYKYRGNVDLSTQNGEKDFLRDLEAIENNILWAANIKSLNYPNEGIYSLEEYFKNLERGTKLLSKVLPFKNKSLSIDELKNKSEDALKVQSKMVGIYSLSEEYNNELMWVHYGNCHKGYCIEYEFDNLQDLDLKRFDKQTYLNNKDCIVKVKYRNQIPMKANVLKNYEMFIDFLSQKSINWKYEREIRLILFSNGGMVYNSKILKSITFGLMCCPKVKAKIIEKLRSKNILFYQMERRKNSYELIR